MRDYLTRFNKATLEVRNLSQEVALSALKRGFRKGRLTFSLDKRLPRSFPELLSRANQYADAEEAAAHRSKEAAEIPPKLRKKRRKEDARTGAPKADNTSWGTRSLSARLGWD